MPAARPATNAPEYSVGELSAALKATVEGGFGLVRVRGEVSGLKRPGSGHVYFTLKDGDSSACLDAAMFRMAASRQTLRPEDGMELVATGRLTIFPDRSRYQLIVERIELAGRGALLAMLEERRRRLTAEGLFDASRRRPLPVLPGVIAVVTSASGAVIHDILHRLAERTPRPVQLWPVLVQGDEAPGQILRALTAIARLGAGDGPPGPVPRPDLVILARGGGSLEDLMAFNDEAVVRAVATCPVPIIAAIGHETDTTLVDLAADRRAPTPTAAAELAVPVRAELLVRLAGDGQSLAAAIRRRLAELDGQVVAQARGLGDPRSRLDHLDLALEARGERLEACLQRRLEDSARRVERASLSLRHPRDLLDRATLSLADHRRRLDRALALRAERGLERVAGLAARLDAADPRARRLAPAATALAILGERLERAGLTALTRAERALAQQAQMLDSLSYRSVLARGYAVARDRDGRPVTSAAAIARVTGLEFHDGTAPLPAAPRRRSGPVRSTDTDGDDQPSLL